jgi:hypothetical protein
MRDARSSQARVLCRCLAASLLLGGCAPAAQRHAAPAGEPETAEVVEELDLAGFFEGIDPRDATFVLLDGATGMLARYNADRAAERFLPASTFKIPNSLIALETGAATGAEFTIVYDSARARTPGFWIDGVVARPLAPLRLPGVGGLVLPGAGAAHRRGADARAPDRLDYGNRSIAGRDRPVLAAAAICAFRRTSRSDSSGGCSMGELGVSARSVARSSRRSWSSRRRRPIG